MVVHEAPGNLGLGAEIAARITEECFYSLEAPVLRVTGFDTPVPGRPGRRGVPARPRPGARRRRPLVRLVTAMTRIKEFNLPDLGEGLTEGEILKWLVAGRRRRSSSTSRIVEVETAKAAVEIPAKWAGKVVEIFHPEGTMVEVGTPIIAIDTDPAAGDLPTPSAASLAAVEVAPAEGAVEPGLIGGPAPGGRTAVLVGYGPKTGRGEAPARARRDGAPVAAAVRAGRSGRRLRPVVRRAGRSRPRFRSAAPTPDVGDQVALAKPPVRKLARDLGVDLRALAGTGPAGLDHPRRRAVGAERRRGPGRRRRRWRSRPARVSSASRSRASAS